MRRRTYLIGIAVAALSLVIGVGAALAAKKHHKHHAVPKPTVELLTCSMSLSTVPPAGQAQVDQPPTQGDMYGPTSCPNNAAFGSGMAHVNFNVPDDGDTVADYTQYFDAGTVSGTFDITPNESPPLSSTGFYSQTWTGPITLDKATGVYTGIKGKPGTGVLNCSTQDSGVHMTCNERIKIVVPPPAAATGTTTSGKKS